MIDEKLIQLSLPYPSVGEKRVRVYVPAHEEGETLPVVYMTDGQNLFDEETSAFGCWHTREAVREEQKTSGKAAVIVGIHNDGSPVQRTNELTPESIGELILPDDMQEKLTPQGEIFDDFVIRTVMPAVEARFPVKTGRAHTAFCGSSSGGLQSFFTALSHPDMFCAAGVFSPAFLLYSEQDMRTWIGSKLRETMPYLYLYSGAGDELEQQIFESTERIYDILMECYPPERMNEVIFPEQRHHESAWEAIFKDFLHTFLMRGEEL